MASSAETFRREPWHELPVALAALIRPRIDAIVADMVEAIREEVSAYRRPLDSAVGRDLLDSIRRALRQFAELTEHPDSPQDHHIRHFRHLGRIEFLNAVRRTVSRPPSASARGWAAGGTPSSYKRPRCRPSSSYRCTKRY
ncbi:hypothetical protein ACFY0R_09580 [Streptomyces sp. NPDC001633]|uniref:hypothetical protein n=1 Tax=Streptomyces sp. NPDC001633 TaxID=3364595 RepID=UPI00367646CD